MSRCHTVKLYYDVISPFSFIGFESLLRHRTVWPIEVELKPVWLPGLFCDSGNPSPAGACERKVAYLVNEGERFGRYFGIPMNLPKNFAHYVTTNSTVEAQRLIVAPQKIAPEKMETVSRHLFSRYWIENLPVCREEDIKTVLEKSRVTNLNEMLEQIKQKDVKE
ncbi:hypothetical protein PENTCL1PPCAC_12762 [Pristionchus entomophagus]|uniref:DSBA-like thioredoxin domain-containing protein n=1 Tax=Pristionchus entomophagus TaxID=358040 RepID=A0AAV5T864_9BILA|nr:hypothetical protein PENTCL1PPCAC_12762 [Pristionchus entomophagus]